MPFPHLWVFIYLIFQMTAYFVVPVAELQTNIIIASLSPFLKGTDLYINFFVLMQQLVNGDIDTRSLREGGGNLRMDVV